MNFITDDVLIQNIRLFVTIIKIIYCTLLYNSIIKTFRTYYIDKHRLYVICIFKEFFYCKYIQELFFFCFFADHCHDSFIYGNILRFSRSSVGYFIILNNAAWKAGMCHVMKTNSLFFACCVILLQTFSFALRLTLRLKNIPELIIR